MISTVVTNLVVPVVFFLWIRCVNRLRYLANTLFGNYIVTNGTIAAAAATMVWAVEHHLCPNDPAVEIVAAFFLFVTQGVTGLAAQRAFASGHRVLLKPQTYRASLCMGKNRKRNATYSAGHVESPPADGLRYRIHAPNEEFSDEEIVAAQEV